MVALHVLEAGGFTAQAAQIIKLCAPDLGGAHQLNLVDYPRLQREDALDALPEADLAHRKAGLWTAAASDHHSLKSLQAFLVAFFDLHMHADSVPRHKRGNVGALGFGKKSFDDQVGHGVSLRMSSSTALGRNLGQQFLVV